MRILTHLLVFLRFCYFFLFCRTLFRHGFNRFSRFSFVFDRFYCVFHAFPLKFLRFYNSFEGFGKFS